MLCWISKVSKRSGLQFFVLSVRYISHILGTIFKGVRKMNNYGAVLSVADDILTLPAEVEALPHSSSAFCGAAGSCAPSVGRGHSPLTLVESRHERGRLSSRPTTPYPPPPHSPVGTIFLRNCAREYQPTPGFGILGQPLAENKVERAGGGLWWWW